MGAKSIASAGELQFAHLPASEDWARIIRLLSVCERQLRRELALKTAHCGLTDADFLLLFSCRQAGATGIPQNELTNVLGTSAASVSVAVEQLKRRDLIRVHRLPSDRRRQFLRLSPTGEQLVEQLLVELTAWTARLQEQISKEELQRGEALLQRIQDVSRETRSVMMPVMPAPAAGAEEGVTT